MKNKRVLVLVMSVGDYKKNYSARYFNSIGAPQGGLLVCLPEQYKEHQKSYEDAGIEVFIYNEQKYIPEIDFLGFTPRNCGGVGRQGIAEAVEKYGGEDCICVQIDDDSSGYRVSMHVDEESIKSKNVPISEWGDFVELVNVLDHFYEKTGVEVMGRSGGTVPVRRYFANREILNNFIMRKGNKLNFGGFAFFVADDYYYNVIHSIRDCVPMLSLTRLVVLAREAQGKRTDGNDVLYRGDMSWKKSFALRMLVPWAMTQRICKEKAGAIFRENLEGYRLFPPVLLSDENGKITGVAVGRGSI